MLCILCALDRNAVALAQTTKTISGRVTDANEGIPLPGVNVIENGTKNGTVTDVDGNYTLKVKDDAIIGFSYIGYVNQEVPVSGRSTININLSEDTQFLGEVVVVGYGTQEKKEISSSVAHVDPDEFNQGNVNDPAQLIQGKVAGLSISKPTGDPNGSFNIRLRGLSTVGAATQPLIIIDGVIGASLENVDPNDIASFDVLKDGSAAAIYGTKASSGVILVTTKKGRSGQAKLNFNSYAAVERIARSVPNMNATEYVAIGGTDLGESTDWLDEITGTGIAQSHNLSISGGTPQTTYRISANYRQTEGVLENSGFESLNGRMNIQQKLLNDRLTVSMNLSATSRDSDLSFLEAMRYAVVYNPTAPVLSDSRPQNGGFFEQDLFDIFNPVAIIEQNIRESQTKTILGDLQLEYQLFEGLNANMTYSQQRVTEIGGEFYSNESFFRGANRNGLARRMTNDKFMQTFETYGTYNRDFNKLNANFLAGYSYQEENAKGDFIEAGDFLSNATTYHNIEDAGDFAAGRAIVTSFRNPDHKTIAFFGRTNLNYDGTYFFSATYRREGDTRFGPENKWGNFYAVSGAVELANLIEVSGVNNLKLRAGFGVTGAIPSFDGLSKLLFDRQGFAVDNGEFIPSFAPVRNPNPDLQWEEKRELDIGIDFSLFEGRLSGALDYYERTTDNFIQQVTVSAAENISDQTFLNVGEFNNTGFEVALNYDAVRSADFNWSTGVVFNTLNTELVSLFLDSDEQDRAIAGSPGIGEVPFIKVREGEDIGNFWGPVYLGADENGEPIFADLDGDGAYCACDDDKQFIGNGLPDFEFGWTNNFQYKNWDLNIFFRGSLGHDLVNTFRLFYEPVVPGQVGSYNRVNSELFDPNLSVANFSSYYVEDGDFVRLDNATIGYSFPLNDNSIFSKIRLYVSGQNLFVITDYEGTDPAVIFSDPGSSSNGGRPDNEIDGVLIPDPLSPGIDRRNSYFRPYTLTFGLNAGF